MLEIKLKKPADGLCPTCEGSGVVIPKDIEMIREVGSFCSRCQEGAKRWAETMRLISENGGIPGAGGSNGIKRL